MTTSPAPAPAREGVDLPSDANDLNGYRGLAALGIVVFHAYQFSRGDATASYAYGHSVAQHVLRNLDGLVSMFLVLSAYLLYLPIARSGLGGARAGVLKVFLLRRAARILPLYWMAILIVWSVRNPALPGDWRDLLEHLTFTQIFDSKRIFYTIGPAWSLSVEIFLYLFLALLIPAFNVAASRISHRAARWALVLSPPIALAVGSFSYQAWALATEQPATRWAIWFNPLARADMFAAGMAVAVIQAARPASARRVTLVGLRIIALGLLGYGCLIRTDDPRPALAFDLLSTVAFALLIASSVFAARDAGWRRALSARWLSWFGLISYSLYIWHEPVLLYLDDHLHLDHGPSFFPVNAGILLVASVPIALLSHRVVERPIGRIRLLLDSHGRRRDYYPGLAPAE